MSMVRLEFFRRARPRVVSVVFLALISSCADSGGDYLFSPNWGARHQRFVDDLNFSVGKRFPSMYCGDSYDGYVKDVSGVQYNYSYRSGCNYSCVVDSSGKIVAVSINEATPNACWTTLN